MGTAKTMWMEHTELKRHVEAIASDIHNGLEQAYCDHCDEFHEGDFREDDTPCPNCDELMELRLLGGHDYTQDALDIEYYVASDKTYLGARILVAFGGPNIWIDTKRGEVEGYWGGETARASFHDDPMAVADAISDIFHC